MATKNDKYSFFEQSFITFKNQNYNLNLNQSGKCPILVPVQSYSKSDNNEYFGTASTDFIASDNYKEREKLQSWNNKVSSFTTLNEGNDDLKKRWKNENTLKTINKSILSLHNPAYENSKETAGSDLFGNVNIDRLKKESIKASKQCFTDSLKSQNPFEFARQKNGDQRNEPEVMQYKSSQQLLGSNQPSSFQKIGHDDGNIVRPQMVAGADRSMAQLAKVDPKEVIRREDYLREHQRPRDMKDPFTWPWPYRAAGTAVALCIGASHMHNSWLRKPWHYALYARMGMTVAAGFIAFTLGNLRVNNYQSREAVTEHYKELHSNDFEAVNDIYGRPFANVLLPWYPKRTQYRRFDE